jgi:signal peptidase II
MMKIKNSGLPWVWLTLVMLVIDQFSKQWVVASMELFDSIKVLPIFSITYVHNPGAAFSFLADQDGWQRWFFTLIAFTASCVFTFWLARTPKKQVLLSIALAFMLGGAIGNLVDRVLFGYVIDFIDFHWHGYIFPAFNIADSSIFIGALLMVIDSFKQQSNEKMVTGNVNSKN